SSGEWRAQLIRLPKGTIAARRNRHPLRPLLRLRALRESFLSFVVKGCLFSLPYFSLVNKMTELDPRRAAVVAEAESWIGTPFHHAARVKGAGVDCLMLLAEVYERAGIVPHLEPPFYVPDWHLHRDAERYLEGLAPHAHEIAGPSQGA